MLVVGGYLITYEQLRVIGARRGLVIEGGNASILNQDWREKGILSVYALPVDYPRSTPTTPGSPHVLICTRKRDDHLVHLADCKPFVENEEDNMAKEFLRRNGITNAPFVAVPDPLYKYNEYGVDCD